MKIYSYRRVSTKQQTTGTSLELQINEEKLKELSEAHGLPVATRVYSDEGKSAYKGEQLQNELGLFLDEVHKGKVKAGSILVCYSLDRISRQKLGLAKQIYLDLTNAGISIFSLLDNYLYKAHIAADDILATIIFERSHNESKTKSARSNAKALKVIQEHLAGKRTEDGYAYQVAFGNNPWWITNREDGAVIEHPYYWNIAKQVQQLFLAGKGNNHIVQYLNKHYKAPHTGKRETKTTMTRLPEWKFSTIASFHRYENLFGRKLVTYRKGKHDEKQYLLDGYYPALMTKEEYYSLHAIKKNRRTADAGRKRFNLVTGLGIAKCGHCGAVIGAGIDKNTRKDNTTKTTARFFCAGSRNLQNGCKGFAVKGSWLETALLAELKGYVFQEKPKDQTKLLALQAEQEAVQRKLDKTKALFMSDLDMMDELAPQMQKLKAEVKQLEQQIEAEQQALGAGEVLEAPLLLYKKWNELTDEALDEENQDIRAEARMLVKQSVDCIEVKKGKLWHFKFTLVDGTEKHVLHNGLRGSRSDHARILVVSEQHYQGIKEHIPELAGGFVTDEAQLDDVNLYKVPTLAWHKKTGNGITAEKIIEVQGLLDCGASMRAIEKATGATRRTVERLLADGAVSNIPSS